MRRDSSDTKRKILTVCVRLFLEQGYKNTSVSQIVDEAGVARGSYLNLFPTKDRILLELTETMFGGQFGVARSIADSKLPPVYAYAVETALQLTLTELNENLREIYIEAYSLPETSEYIYLHTTAELKQIFGGNFPDYSDSDFYEMEIGTAADAQLYGAEMRHPFPVGAQAQPLPDGIHAGVSGAGGGTGRGAGLYPITGYQDDRHKSYV